MDRDASGEIDYKELARAIKYGDPRRIESMNAQARKDFKRADTELNTVYRKVIALLPDEKSVELLQKAQRAWVAFRDANAAFHADEMRGGSAAPLLFYGQQTQLTKSRLKHLQRYLKDFGER